MLLLRLPVIVKVTNDHIDQGVVHCPYRCPVALCLQEQFQAPIVSEYRVLFFHGTRLLVFQIPRDMQWWIRAFDVDRFVLPTTFKLWNLTR